MRRRVSGKTAGEEVSWVQLYGWSGGQARDCAEGLGSVQATNPGDHGTGKRRQHEDDDGGTGTVYAGLAQLFRILRNAGSADRFNSLGSVATQGGSVAAVEDTAPSPGGAVGTGGARAAGEQYRRQRSRPLVSREGQGPGRGAFECVLQIAGTSIIVRGLLAQPSRTAVYGPVRTVVWQGSAGDRRPYADQTALSEKCGPPGVVLGAKTRFAPELVPVGSSALRQVTGFRTGRGARALSRHIGSSTAGLGPGPCTSAVCALYVQVGWFPNGVSFEAYPHFGAPDFAWRRFIPMRWCDVRFLSVVTLRRYGSVWRSNFLHNVCRLFRSGSGARPAVGVR